MITGVGRYFSSSFVTPTAADPGPLLPWGLPNVLWRLKNSISKPASFALVTPMMAFALAWS